MARLVRATMLFFLLFGTSLQAAAQQPLQWHTNLETATQLAKETNRPILVHFWATWCKPCMRLEHEVFNQASVASAIEANFIPVKLNADQYAAVAKNYGVNSLPTDVVLAPSGQVLAKANSPLEAAAYIKQVGQIAMHLRSQQQTQLAANPAVPPINNPYAALAASQPASPQAPQQATVQPSGPYGPPPVAPQRPADASVNRYAAQQSSHPQPQTQTPPPANPYTTAPASSSLVGSRYAQAEPSPTGGPMNHPASAPMAQSPVSTPAGGPYGYHNPAAAAPPVTQDAPAVPVESPAVPPQTPQPQPSYQVGHAAPTGPAGVGVGSQVANNQPMPSGKAEVCMEGFCPVTLMENQRWAPGDPRFGAIHRGRTYLFTTQAGQQRFLSNPDMYSPVLSGNDPVLAIDQRQTVSGNRRHGVYFRDRIYLFSSEATLDQFVKNPHRYASGVRQATQTPTGVMAR